VVEHLAVRVLSATRAQRLRTLAYVEREMEAIGFDDEVARLLAEES